jgi:diguanylate cyclase (GGDEF)-like protein
LATPAAESETPSSAGAGGDVVEALMSEVAIRIDRAGRPRHVSASCRRVLGLEPREILDADGGAAADPLSARAAVMALCCLAPGEVSTIPLRRGDGEPVWIDAQCHAEPSGEHRLLLLRDVTGQRETERRLHDALDRLARLANEDALTGLANRTCLLEMAERLIGGVEGVALLFLDLDGFRPINDMHGHAIGDVILRETATRLARELLHEPLVARLGGDEFAVLMRATDGDAAVAARARDIIRVISEPVEVGQMTLDVTATIGIAIGPRDGARGATLLRAAGIAMNQARQCGGGSYRFFEQRMSEELSFAEELKADLRPAIAAGEVAPFFHPLVRLADQVVVGFEVLARWEHPMKGVLPPARFLPLVEELGLSAAMLASILTQACTVARDWPNHVKLAINVSPHELQDESLPEDIRAILDSTGFPGSRLEIEVTENALIHDSRIARGVIDRLRALGISIALDDFGTGFSSLYHLRELPFDKIKIDKSFMHALDTDAQSARYVSAIIGLGQALGLAVTAEGIEDPVTMRRLQDLGCDYGQGYLFGRPMPAADAGAVLVANRLPMLAAE